MEPGVPVGMDEDSEFEVRAKFEDIFDIWPNSVGGSVGRGWVRGCLVEDMRVQVDRGRWWVWWAVLPSLRVRWMARPCGAWRTGGDGRR